jgi:hypothetical protein
LFPLFAGGGRRSGHKTLTRLPIASPPPPLIPLIALFLFVATITHHSIHYIHFYLQYGRARDPVGYLRDVEQRGRERQVAYETVKLLRQKVIECYRKQGVNHYEDCRDVGQQYYDVVIKKNLGQLQPEWITK